MNGDLSLFLTSQGIDFIKNAPMKEYSSIRIGGIAEYMIFPDNEEKLIEVVRFFNEKSIKHKVIGKMSNILPCDGFYEGVLINTKLLNHYSHYENTVFCQCGVLFPTLLARMSVLNLGGLESLALIPGTAGGMIASNAGAYGKEISDFLISLDAYIPSSKKRCTFSKDELEFGYRSSFIKSNGMVVLSARFQFEEKNTEHISRDISKIIERRKRSQPIEKASLGSIFKKSGELSSGYLIEQCGLKGFSVGDAEISSKHAGFIINKGNATADDVKKLIAYVKNKVEFDFGVLLNEEIEYLK